MRRCIYRSAIAYGQWLKRGQDVFDQTLADANGTHNRFGDYTAAMDNEAKESATCHQSDRFGMRRLRADGHFRWAIMRLVVL
jgi:hypothetical protein